MRVLVLAAVLGSLFCFAAAASAAAPDAAVPVLKARDTASGAARLDLNTVTREELVSVPGIGPATAQAILDLRGRKGSFSRLEELLEVRGIGERNLKKIALHVAVFPRSASSPASMTTSPAP